MSSRNLARRSVRLVARFTPGSDERVLTIIVTPVDQITKRSSLLLGRNHFRDPANTGVARIQVALLIPGHVVAFDELTFPNTRSVTHLPEYVAVPVYLQK